MEHIPKIEQPQSFVKRSSVAHENSTDLRFPRPEMSPKTQQIPSASNHPFISGNLIVPPNAEFIDNTDPKKFAPELRLMTLQEHFYKTIIFYMEQAYKKIQQLLVITILKK